jgi:hypothetical protein
MHMHKRKQRKRKQRQDDVQAHAMLSGVALEG